MIFPRKNSFTKNELVKLNLESKFLDIKESLNSIIYHVNVKYT